MSIVNNLYQITRNEGILALTNGISASLIGLLHPLVFFPMYEKLKIYFRESNPDLYTSKDDKLANKHILMASIVSKVSASIVSYPHEVLRSRLQYEHSTHGHAENNAFHLIRRIIRTEGYRALYSGFITNLFRIVPNYAVIFMIYENLSYLFGVQN